ncbi:hypothetical protein [Microvirga arsenatis]|uniref:Uncharacterized protein n=1 Tax=Microvirga arsenatis TaxID=2692265 RepID=A0ABW9YZA2_9HYPH|nr:hypothetical protein [Microvirga arsenatis]NBJ10932.1 hypothetical protein [Microvirga arsenatis]NBJ24171.1 hypothetical protein [Microvirga arsenatis]
MARKMDYGDWAQIIGTFDLSARRGTILSMLPTKVAFASLEGGEERVRVKGVDEAGAVLFDLAVNPMTVSCGIAGSDRMFEEFVPVTPSLRYVRLFIDGIEVSQYAPGSAEPKGQVELAAPAPGREHHIPLSGNAPAEPNVSYLLQVRPDGDTRWHTMAAGLDRPNVADVDINQFPGASALEIRVLRSNGLETTEVFQERREF